MRTIGSLFSGVGGFELGLERAGCGSVRWQVEIDPKCQRVLAKHWPHVTRYSDVRTVGSHNLSPVWLICGGFPCQDVSAAGKGAGLHEGTRSGLWFEYRRIVGELRPEWVAVENVASGKKRWLPQVRRDLHMLGYDSVAFGLSAADVGAPHLRRRVFVVAHPYSPLLRVGQGRGRGPDGEGGQAAPDADRERLEVGLVQQARHERATAERDGLFDNPWAVEPGMGRVAYGVPDRVDRLKQLGNAVVPQCAEAIGRYIASVAA